MDSRSREEFKRGLRQPTTIEYIQNILRQYPDDGQILKELIQNADDAGAETVSFLLDENRHESCPEKLSHPELDQFMGPALYTYNDAVFKDEDWKGICLMQKSVKSQTPIKTGQFGLGFKSVFHLTDMPMILSGDYIGFIDPHEKYLPGRRSAYPWGLEEDCADIQSNIDQFKPLSKDIFQSDGILNNLGTPLQGSYPHTLFRFPLRRTPSELSNNIFSAERLNELLQSLIIDNGQYLLFLKSVKCIEIYVRKQGQQSPKLVHRARSCFDQTEPNVTRGRQEFLSKISNPEIRTKDSNPHCYYRLSLETETFDEASFTSEKGKTEWMIAHSYENTGFEGTAKLTEELGILPWVGIAFPICKENSSENIRSSLTGRLFVSLPLPLDGTEDTGLPFHVHAFFAVEQNRRHIKWATTDHDPSKLSDPSRKWNQVLVRYLVPNAVLAFLSKLIDENLDGTFTVGFKDIYRAMPDLECLNGRWKPLGEHLYKNLFERASVFVPVGDGEWKLPKHCFVLDQSITPDEKTVVRNLVLSAKMPLISPPSHVVAALANYCTGTPKVISVQDIRKAVLNTGKPAKQSAVILLQYLWKIGEVQDLIGLPLLPLMTGDLVEFKRNSGEKIYITSDEHPADLLQTLKWKLVDNSLESGVGKVLQKIQETGGTQLDALSFDTVLNLLQEVEPPSWSNRDRVEWRSSELTVSWLAKVWHYLNRNGYVEADKISMLHILPISESEWGKVNLSKKAILKEEKGPLFEEVYQLLSLLGCLVIGDIPDFLKRNSVFDRLSFQPHTPKGVLNLIRVLKTECPSDFRQHLSQIIASKNGLVSNFVNYMSKYDMSELDESNQSLLKSLPLFKTVAGSGGVNQQKFSSVSETPFSGPLLDVPVYLPRVVLDASDHSVRKVLDDLEVQCYHNAPLSKVFDEMFLPEFSGTRYNIRELSSIFAFFLDHLQDDFMENQTLVRRVKNVRCVSTETGEMCYPSELFDPQDPLLVDLLDANKFPSSEFHTRKRLLVLKILGMRTADAIRPDEAVDIAKSICDKPARDRVFLEILRKLHNTSSFRNNRDFWVEISKIPFLPVVQTRPPEYPTLLPWFGESGNSHYSGSELLHVDHYKTVGSIQPLVEGDSALLDHMLTRSFPDSKDILSQLQLIIKHYVPEEKQYYLPLIDNIYSALAKRPGDMTGLQGKAAWVWSGDGFRTVDEVLSSRKKGSIDLDPFVVILPPEMTKHSSFFEKHGMQNQIDPAKILHMISEAHKQSKRNRFVEHDLSIAIKILQQVDSSNTDILVPVKPGNSECLEFRPASNCTRKISSAGLQFDLEGVMYVHPSVPQNICENLSIPTEISRGAGSEAFGVEACGQSEPLTRRLATILEDYSYELSFVNEMIQNADDAGATEVNIVYDMRMNLQNRHKLLDPAMAALQGPAVWVHNNSLFSNEDFQNIEKLNAGTKKEKMDLIGKFGLGFNVVYNFTDVPCFLSGEYMVCFDPHFSYLGNALRDKTVPGIKFKVANSGTNVLREFSDQFAPWNGVCGCNLKTESSTRYDGTLFRLPLRGQPGCIPSKISKKVSDSDDFKALFQLISAHASELLLFTQNVSKFSVKVIPEDTVNPETEMHNILEITKEPVKFLKHHGARIDTEKRHAGPLSEFTNETSILKAAIKTCNNPLDSVFIMKSVINVTEQGRIFLSLEGNTSYENLWLIGNSASAIGEDEQARIGVCGIAMKLEQHGVGYHLQKVGDNDGNLCGSYYHFLPLPIKCKMPYHLNGMFSIESSRRHITMSTGHETNSGGNWNQKLMEHGMSRVLLNILKMAKHILTPTDDIYLFFPVDNEGDLLKFLTRGFWKQVLQKIDSPEIFNSQSEWVRLNEAFYLDYKSFKGKETLQATAKKVIRAELTSNRLVELPPCIQDLTMNINPVFMQKKIISEEDFIEKYLLHNLGSDTIDSEERDAILLHVLANSSESAIRTMSYLPCIPVSGESGILRKPCELVHPEGKAACLYKEEDGKFPCFTVGDYPSHCTAYARLCEIGMCKDILIWEDICERAEAIVEEDMGPDQAKKLVHYLDWMIHEKSVTISQEDKESLSVIRFIPVKECPVEWDVEWRGDSLRYCSGGELLFHENPLIACSQYAIPREDLGISPDLASFLGMTMSISIEDAVQHLIEISGHTPLPAIVRQSLMAVYNFLERSCVGDHILETIKNQTADKEIIYIESEGVFALPSKCSNHLDFKASPYMFEVSPGSYPKFFKCVGVREEFEPQDYIGALGQLKEDVGENPLSETQIAVTNNLLQGLHKCIEKRKMKIKKLKEFGNIYLPDTRAILYAAHKLTYFDVPWIEGDLPYLMTHRIITYPIAKCLGVRDVRSQLLFDKSKSLGSPFGQKEELVSRIKNILKSYPFGPQFLVEFAQNADDAGATELHFLLDKQTYKDKRLFGPKWKYLQGPALCIYNNAPFTLDDLNGISSLGKGSKKNDASKIGQYGVGLNIMYHVTDVPLIHVPVIDRDQKTKKLIALDPTCQYVPGATSGNAGRIFSDLPDLKKVCPDVFPCFMEEKFNNGAFFRLPLHNQNLHSISDITRTPQDIEFLFSDFKKSWFEILLFVTSLKRIHISVIEKDGSVKEEVVKASMSENDLRKMHEFKTLLEREATCLRSGEKERSISATEKSQIAYLVDIEDKWSHEKWRIVQQCGVDHSCEISENLNSAFKDGLIPALPIGGIAYLRERKSKRPKKYQIHVYGEHNHARKVFSGLPLPVKTNLPVHINGHFILDHESRQHLWGGRGDGYKTAWNKYLCESVVAPCYATCIEMERAQCTVNAAVKTKQPIAYQIEHSIQNYYGVFPLSSETKQCHEAEIVKCLCELIRNMPVLPFISAGNKLQWCSIEGNEMGYFLPPDSQHDEKQGITCKCEFCIAALCTMKTVICRLPNIIDVLKKHLKVTWVTPSAVIDFFKHMPPSLRHGGIFDVCYPEPSIWRSCIKNVIEYCMKDPEFDQKLEGLPLLVTSNNRLCVFSCSSPVFKSEYIKLVEPCSDEFLHPEFIKTFEKRNSEVFKDFKIEDFAPHFELKYPNLISLSGAPIKRPRDISKEFLDSTWTFLKKKWDDSTGSFDKVKDFCLILVMKKEQKKSEETTGQKTYLERLPQHVDIAHLFPLSSAGYLFPSSSDYAYGISEVNFHTKFFTLSETADTTSWLTKQKYMANWGEPSSIPKALCYHQSLGAVPSSHDAYYLLQYLVRNIGKLSNHALGYVKELKIFETVGNKYVDGTGHVYVIPSDIPLVDMDSWTHGSKHRFLKCDNGAHKLYKRLGFFVWEEAKIYIEFIIPQMEMEQEGIEKGYWDHMLHMVHKFMDEPNVLRCLESSSIVKCREGTLEKRRQASELFDDKVELFKAMEDKSDFPVEPPSYLLLEKENWKKFLKKIGLVHCASVEMVMTYAEKLAQKQAQGTAAEGEIKIIFKHLEEHMEKPAQLNCLESIKNTAFIPTKLFIEKIECEKTSRLRKHRYYPTGLSNFTHMETKEGNITCKWERLCPTDKVPPLIPLANSVLDRGDNIDLTWTEAGVIKDYFSAKKWKEVDLSGFGIITSPPMEMVMSHLRNIASYYSDQNNKIANVDDAKLMENIVAKCFKYMSDMLRVSDNKDCIKECISQLRSSRCIFLTYEQAFVDPCFVVLDMEYQENFGTYLVQAPSYLREYKDLLTLLGCAPKPTPLHYQAVLEKIHMQYQLNELNVNASVYQNALGACRNIFSLLQSGGETNLDASVELWLLSRETKLVDASKIIFIDSPTIFKRLTNTSDMHFLHDMPIHFPLEMAFEKLPKTHRPRKLTSVTREVLCNVEHVTGILPSATKLEEKLHSSNGMEAVQRLVKHIILQNHSKKVESYYQEMTKKICDTMKQIQVIPVKQLQTVVTNNDGLEIGSRQIKSFHLDASRSHLYVNEITLRKQKRYVYFILLLAEMIDENAQGFFKNNKHLLMAILGEEEEDMIPQLLDDLKITV